MIKTGFQNVNTDYVPTAWRGFLMLKRAPLSFGGNL